MTTTPDQPRALTGLNAALSEMKDAERLAEYIEVMRSSGSYVTHDVPDGPVFSIETRSANGMHHIVGIEPRQLSDQQEVLPPPGEADSAVLRSAVRGLLDLTGYESGTARVEVVLLPQGPRINAIWLDAAHWGAE
ncbi:hypothetical protein OG568_48510 (plasmid) [Streptomyces sp. NBC_01450]|uniref:hypothetical protein n=1 Tax=Streptomyces sp. NBC_01450 TaxID=2903871 RepID=UPI002E32181E|nr:hypothetical protein [Streptomyces sp. NBC_01450]